MSKKSLVKIVSVVLSLLILLTVLPLGVSATDTAAVTPEAGNVTEKIIETTTGQRVRAEEGDSLYTIVTDNGDGTHTLTLYDHPVKFIDAKGKLQDISLEITTAENGAYKTKANEIQTVFPNKISDGITLSGKGVDIKLTPGRGELRSPAISEDLTAKPYQGVRTAEDVGPYINGISADVTVTRIDNETVSYYYDNKTTLEYSLTYTGFKEDIVVSEYTGQTEYHFLLETGGLTLTKIDESYYLTDENGEIKATLGDIIIFTADERNNALGSMTHETVKENEQYIITIHVDAEYLKDEKTKYPIRIDPTIEITYDSNGSGAIQDVTLNELSGSSGSSGSIYVGKRNTYGISRTLMKFPGLNLNGIVSANDITSAHVEIRDMLCETTSMMVYGCIFTGNDWTESTANWSNTLPSSYTEMPNAYAEVNYSNGNAKNPKHRYSIDITQAVQSWKTGFYDQAKGIMLKASDEVEYGSALYKTFASYNRSSNKPSLKVNYNSLPVTETVGITSGNYYYIQNVHSGLHLDIYNANQTSGTNLIQYILTGAQNQKFQFLYIGSGEYEIKPAHVSGMNLTATSNGAVCINADINSNAQRWYIYWIDYQYCFINKAYNSKKLSVNGSTASATAVTISDNSGYYWSIGGSDKSIDVAKYNLGVRMAKLHGQYYYDYTTPINNMFNNNVDLCYQNRCLNYTQYCAHVLPLGIVPTPDLHVVFQANSFVWFYTKVKRGAEWDIKLQEKWTAAMPGIPYLGQQTQFVFRTLTINAEDLGNIMYGYVGRATGFGDITLYWGGGVAKTGSMNNEDVNTPPLYGDDQNDHDAIELGYNMFISDYPDYPEIGYNGIPIEEGILAELADKVF